MIFERLNALFVFASWFSKLFKDSLSSFEWWMPPVKPSEPVIFGGHLNWCSLIIVLVCGGALHSFSKRSLIAFFHWLRMDLRNLKKSLQAKSAQSDLQSDLSSLAMSHLNSLPMNPFSQLNSVNMSQLLGKFTSAGFIVFDGFLVHFRQFYRITFGCSVNSVYVEIQIRHPFAGLSSIADATVLAARSCSIADRRW